jgi:hypothetical protein
VSVTSCYLITIIVIRTPTMNRNAWWNKTTLATGKQNSWTSFVCAIDMIMTMRPRQSVQRIGMYVWSL